MGDARKPTTPTDRAKQLLHTIDVAHSKLKQAWAARPDGDLQTGQTNTGRISSSRIPDPASDAAANLERLRTHVLATVVDLTADLAQTVGTDPSPAFRCRRMVDILALHRQYAGQLLTAIRQHEADPTEWDDAQTLTGTLASHAQIIHRVSMWAYGRLAQPNAQPNVDVCDGNQCQRPVFDGTVLCDTCQARKDRAQAKAEQRRRQIRADRANGLRCHGEIRECEEMLTDRDRQRGRRNCSQCRRHADRPVDADGWPLCASDHRPCGRRLPVEDAEKGQRNCGACRAHDVRNPHLVAQHVESNR